MRGITIAAKALALFGLIAGATVNSYSINNTLSTPPAPKAPVINRSNSFSATDATKAYNAFNAAYYSPSDKLYYSTTEKKGIGAIWTQAIYWDMAMNAYERNKDRTNYKPITDIYEGGSRRYDNYNWNNTTTWFIYDDMMWWIMALSRAYTITKNPAYLEQAKAGFKHVWDGSYDSAKGGLFWDFKHSGKNACINYPTVIAAMRLYNITKDKSYLDKAKSIYTWAHDNLFDTAKGRVADHKIGDNKAGYEDYTYNQGTCIGAALLLYKVTKSKNYLDDAKLAAQYTKNVMSDANGILPAEGDFNEQGVLKAIFAQYLVELAKAAPQDNYGKWAIHNADTAWANRDQTRNITHRNYKILCPTGVIQSYESSSAVAFMQLFAPAK